MIWVSLGAEVLRWSVWLWRHRKEFEPLFAKANVTGEILYDALADPNGAIRRVGNIIVFGRADGGEKIMAFIEETAPKTDAIQNAVDGLGVGQAALSASLASLQGLSMITLGLTAFTSVVLGFQFTALKRRLDTLETKVEALHKKFDAAVLADLRTGLDLLEQGQDFLQTKERGKAHSRFIAGLPYCIRSMKYFSHLLGDHLNQAKADLGELRLLSRHLAIAILGVASCQIGMEQDRHAFGQSRQELDLLRQAAGQVFEATIGSKPGAFLHPGLQRYGVTLDFLAQLSQQAQDAGILDKGTDCSASAWFERHREEMFEFLPTGRGVNPAMFPKVLHGEGSALRDRVQLAVTAVEETNRVLGLSRLVEHVRASGRTTLKVVQELNSQKAGQEGEPSPYMAWGLG
jgi:hypothetical protein